MAQKIIELLEGLEDDILIHMIFNLLTDCDDPKEMMLQIMPFLEGATFGFMEELWALCLDGQRQVSGIPSKIIEERKQRVLVEADAARHNRPFGFVKAVGPVPTGFAGDGQTGNPVQIGKIADTISQQLKDSRFAGTGRSRRRHEVDLNPRHETDLNCTQPTSRSSRSVRGRSMSRQRSTSRPSDSSRFDRSRSRSRYASTRRDGSRSPRSADAQRHSNRRTSEYTSRYYEKRRSPSISRSPLGTRSKGLALSPSLSRRPTNSPSRSRSVSSGSSRYSSSPSRSRSR